MKKKVFGCLLCLSLMAALTACKRDTDSPKDTKEPATETMAVTETKGEEEQVLAGEVVDASMNSITVTSEKGDELSFITSGAEMDIKHGIVIGNMVYIHYTGTIEGTDTSKALVVKVVDNSENDDVNKTASMEISEVKDTVYAVTALHVRESWMTSSAIVGNYAAGDAISRTGVCSNGWMRVDYNGSSGYVYGEYVSSSKPDTTATQAPHGVEKDLEPKEMFTTAGVNVRKNYTTESTRIGSCKSGTSVEVNGYVIIYGDAPDWYRVNFNGMTGYISAKYMTETKPSTMNETPANTGGNSEPTENVSEVFGTCDGTSMNTLTVMVSDGEFEGQELTFYIGDSAITGSKYQGAKAAVHYTGSIDGTDTSNAIVYLVEFK